MSSNIYTEAKVYLGKGDTDGNLSVELEFAGCYSEFFDKKTLTEDEIFAFKKGVLAERERCWDKMADILDDSILKNINYTDLFE